MRRPKIKDKFETLSEKSLVFEVVLSFGIIWLILNTSDLVIYLNKNLTHKNKSGEIIIDSNYFREEKEIINMFPSVEYKIEENHIIYIDLKKKNLTSIPEDLKNFKFLRILNLRRNFFTEIPKWFGDLKCLEELNLSGNFLTFIPKSFENIINLKKLYLGGNRLKSIDPIQNLINLEEIDLSFNKISFIPKNFYNLLNLKKINLAGNRLKSIDPIQNLINLEEIDLSFNKFDIFPHIVENFKYLQVFRYVGNQLSVFPEAILNLSNLKKIDLSNNYISFIPESIGHLKSLQEIYLNRNQITVIPKRIKYLKGLIKLDLSKNNITTFSENFGEISLTTAMDLQEIGLQNNPIKSLTFVSPDLMEKINISSDNLTSKGKFLYIKGKYNDLFQYYKKSSINLAIQYLSDYESLTKDEKIRLVYESGIVEKEILETKLSIDDEILNEISERMSIMTERGYKIYL